MSMNGLKLYHRVPRTALPIHFFRHFCCRIYRLATKRTTKQLIDINSRLLASIADYVNK